MPVSEHLGVGRLLADRRRQTVDRQPDVRLDLALAVDRLADDVQHPAQRPLADRHGDRTARVLDLGAPHQPVGRVHRDGSHHIVAAMLLDFQDEAALLATIDLERMVDLRQVLPLEDDVDDRTDDLVDAPGPFLLWFVLLFLGLLCDCH